MAYILATSVAERIIFVKPVGFICMFFAGFVCMKDRVAALMGSGLG